MSSFETPGIRALDEAFPADKPFPPAPYRELALAESSASAISYAGNSLSGFLRPLGLVRAQLTASSNPPEKVDGYMRAITARHERLAERLGKPGFRIRALLGATALVQCSPETAAHILTLMQQGYTVDFADAKLTADELGGPTVEASTVLLGEGGGLYVQHDLSKGAPEKEVWLPGESSERDRYLALHEGYGGDVLRHDEVVAWLEDIGAGR